MQEHRDQLQREDNSQSDCSVSNLKSNGEGRNEEKKDGDTANINVCAGDMMSSTYLEETFYLLLFFFPSVLVRQTNGYRNNKSHI